MPSVTTIQSVSCSCCGGPGPGCSVCEAGIAMASSPVFVWTATGGPFAPDYAYIMASDPDNCRWIGVAGSMLAPGIPAVTLSHDGAGNIIGYVVVNSGFPLYTNTTYSIPAGVASCCGDMPATFIGPPDTPDFLRNVVLCMGSVCEHCNFVELGTVGTVSITNFQFNDGVVRPLTCDMNPTFGVSWKSVRFGEPSLFPPYEAVNPFAQGWWGRIPGQVFADLRMLIVPSGAVVGSVNDLMISCSVYIGFGVSGDGDDEWVNRLPVGVVNIRRNGLGDPNTCLVCGGNPASTYSGLFCGYIIGQRYSFFEYPACTDDSPFATLGWTAGLSISVPGTGAIVNGVCGIKGLAKVVVADGPNAGTYIVPWSSQTLIVPAPNPFAIAFIFGAWGLYTQGVYWQVDPIVSYSYSPFMQQYTGSLIGATNVTVTNAV